MTGRVLGVVVLAGGSASRMGGVTKPALLVGGVRLIDRVIAAAVSAGPVVVVASPDLALPPHVHRTREEPPGGGPVAALAAGLAALTEGARAWLSGGPSAGDSDQPDRGRVAGSADLPGDPGDGAVVLLGGDLPFVTADAIAVLVSRLDDRGCDGVAFADSAGRPQWMCSAWRYGPLAARLRSTSGPAMDGPAGGEPTGRESAEAGAAGRGPAERGSIRADRVGRGPSMRRLVEGLRVDLIDSDSDSGVAGDRPPPWFDCDTEDDLRRAEEWWTR